MTPLAPLVRHGREVSSIFDLLGRKENDFTAALAFTLGRSPALLGLILRRLAPESEDEQAELRLEEPDAQGRTDLEISTRTRLIIIEAKRGWLLPGETQLARYAPRVAAHDGGILASLSAASTRWAQASLPAAVQDVPVVHLPWDHVRADLAAAGTAARGQERTWLDEFSEYLRKAVKMLDPADSWTYFVTVGNGRPGDGGPRTFRDFITTEGCYFHPYGWGSGWPRPPRTSSPSAGTATSSKPTASPAPTSSPPSRTAGPTSRKPATPPGPMPCIISARNCSLRQSRTAPATGHHACGSSSTSSSLTPPSRTPSTSPH